MRKIFLTTVTAQDPYIVYEGGEKLGPVLNMFYKSDWSVLVLWVPEALQAKGKELADRIRTVFADCEVLCQVIRLDNKQRLMADLRKFLKQYTQSQPARLFLGLNPGFPEVNALWIDALSKKKLEAKIVLPDEHYFETEYLWEEIQTEAPEPESVPVPSVLECQDSSQKNLYEDILASIGLVGEDPAFKEVLSVALAIAEHSVAVLLKGETGTGKDLLARLIHKVSPRSHKPFVCLNCAAIPEHLSESILFGHKKGSFTGAVDSGLGKFRAAHQGTLFLDEIGELSPKVQASLLRALESGFIEPVGEVEPVAVDVRIIAATHKNLLEEVRSNRFREDLYYRLHVGVVTSPPLRNRKSDIPRLVNSFLAKINKSLRQPRFVSQAALQAMLDYKWPGNIRELQNTLQRAILTSKEAVLDVKDLFPTKSHPEEAGHNLPDLGNDFSLEDYLGKLRSRIIHKALGEAQGKQNRAAQLLGISPQAVNHFLKTEDSCELN